jgi:hypothetical protein
MARTKAEIEQEIENAKDAEASLVGITTTSRASVWVGIKRVVAFAIRQLELLWDAKKRELEEAAASAISGTAQWYAEQVRIWQYNYSLSEQNGRLGYLVIDEDARLASKVAVTVSGKTLQVKVAKDDGNGGLEPLTVDEKVSLDSYMRAIKFAGTQHVVISTDSDKVRVTGTVYYDGKLDLTEFENTFKAALNQFLKDIFFDGVLNKNRLRDAGERVIGVNDFDFTLLEAKPDGGNYVAVPREYAPVSGYYEVDVFNLTFVPQ